MNTQVPKSLPARTLTLQSRGSINYSLCAKLSPTSVFECSEDVEVFCFIYIFKWLREIRLLCNMWLLYKIQISIFVNKMLLEHVHLFLCCRKKKFFFPFYYNKSWGVTPEHDGLQSSRYLPSGPLQKDLPVFTIETRGLLH